jgi:hypothetical protein
MFLKTRDPKGGSTRPKSKPAVKNTPDPVVSERIAQLLRALDHELWEVSLHTAMIGSYLNRLGLSDKWVGRKEILRLIPSDPIAIPAIVDDLVDEIRWSGPTKVFQTLCFTVGEAKGMLTSALVSEGLQISRVQRDELTGIWQAAAGAAILCLYARDRLFEHVSQLKSARSIDQLAETLMAVRDGQGPLWSEGVAALPDWARQRVHRRILLNESATLQAGGETHDVRVVDVSRGGVGLDFAKELAVDSLVVIKLRTGRRMVGRVAWCRAGRTGIEFASELTPTDPLISSG